MLRTKRTTRTKPATRPESKILSVEQKKEQRKKLQETAKQLRQDLRTNKSLHTQAVRQHKAALKVIGNSDLEVFKLTNRLNAVTEELSALK